MFFFFNDTATTEIYTLSLHDALPICLHERGILSEQVGDTTQMVSEGAVLAVSACLQCSQIQSVVGQEMQRTDRKSTRLNSSHLVISYAVFCLKKKKQTNTKQVEVDVP